MTDVFNIITNLFTSVKTYIYIFFSILVTGISLITSISAWFNVNLKEMTSFFDNWKDRKAVNYKITSSIYDNSLEVDKTKNFIWQIMDLFGIYYILVLIWVEIYIIEKTSYVYVHEINMSAYILLTVCASALIISCIVSRLRKMTKIYYYISSILCLLMGNYCGILLAIYIFLNFSNNIKFILLLIFLCCTFNFVVTENIYSKNKFGSSSLYKKAKYTRVIREIEALVFMMVVFWDALNNNQDKHKEYIYVILFILWFLLCILEDWFFVNSKSDKVKMEIKIYRQNNCDKIYSKIYQYGEDKVKYTLKNGNTKIVDSNEILSIDYILKNCNTKNSKKISCFLKNGEVLNFDDYQFVQGEWVAFYKKDENVNHVKIINNQRIKEIVSENLCSLK